VGAALHGLDRLAAGDEAKARIRSELTAAVDAARAPEPSSLLEASRG
jgi:hypothetical protein